MSVIHLHQIYWWATCSCHISNFIDVREIHDLVYSGARILIYQLWWRDLGDFFPHLLFVIRKNLARGWRLFLLVEMIDIKLIRGQLLRRVPYNDSLATFKILLGMSWAYILSRPGHDLFLLYLFSRRSALLFWFRLMLCTKLSCSLLWDLICLKYVVDRHWWRLGWSFSWRRGKQQVESTLAVDSGSHAVVIIAWHRALIIVVSFAI